MIVIPFSRVFSLLLVKWLIWISHTVIKLSVLVHASCFYMTSHAPCKSTFSITPITLSTITYIHNVLHLATDHDTMQRRSDMVELYLLAEVTLIVSQQTSSLDLYWGGAPCSFQIKVQGWGQSYWGARGPTQFSNQGSRLGPVILRS